MRLWKCPILHPFIPARIPTFPNALSLKIWF
jgi:hypothetical protein